MASKSHLSFAERAANHTNPLTRRLFEIAEQKSTNIVLSADLTSTDELLKIADGEHEHVQPSTI
jgi:orotidine-5'-phosphate decarboxylase